MPDYTIDQNGHYHVTGKKGTYTIPFVIGQADAPHEFISSGDYDYSSKQPIVGQFCGQIQWNQTVTEFNHTADAQTFTATDGVNFSVTVQGDSPPGPTFTDAYATGQYPQNTGHVNHETGPAGIAYSGTMTVEVLKDQPFAPTGSVTIYEVAQFYLMVKNSVFAPVLNPHGSGGLFAVGYFGQITVYIDAIDAPCGFFTGITQNKNATFVLPQYYGYYYVQASASTSNSGGNPKSGSTPPLTFAWSLIADTPSIILGDPPSDSSGASIAYLLQDAYDAGVFTGVYAPPKNCTATLSVTVTDSSSPPCVATASSVISYVADPAYEYAPPPNTPAPSALSRANLSAPLTTFCRAEVKTSGTPPAPAGIIFYRAPGPVPKLTNGTLWDVNAAVVSANPADTSPALVTDSRTLLYCAFQRQNTPAQKSDGIYLRRSDDGGKTWNTLPIGEAETVSIPNAITPALASGGNGMLLLAASGTDAAGYTLFYSFKGLGDTAFSPGAAAKTSGGGSIAVQKTGIAVCKALEGPDRWVMSVLVAGETKTSEWWSADDGKTWTRIAES